MIVYKYFLKVAWQNKWSIITYALIFFVLTLLNSASTENREVTFEEVEFDIGIIDNSKSDLSNGLIEYLDEGNRLVELEDDMDTIKDQLFLEEINAAIIIPENFTQNFKEKEKSLKIIKDDRKITSLQIENEINKYLIFANSKETNESNLNEVSVALDKETSVEVLQADESDVNTSANTWFEFYFNFTSFVIIATYIGTIGLVMADFNEESIEKRTKISSKKLFNFNTEMYLGQITIGASITLLFILGSIVLKGNHIGEVDFIKYMLNILVFSFSILCLTFLINNLTKDRYIINGLSTIVSLGSAFLSGVFVSQNLLGETALNIAKFFPTYYFVRANGSQFNSVSDIGYELTIQILFGIAFLLLGLYFSKNKQKA